ncbi:hypothetical protein [Tautonia rosea]|uniref:hypothetical protein n=1 Tax=Tautonia rosea TaxID=2728037 RepID=UPI001475EAC2|nr:hypothetical protein [Tautonia rosea]
MQRLYWPVATCTCLIASLCSSATHAQEEHAELTEYKKLAKEIVAKGEKGDTSQPVKLQVTYRRLDIHGKPDTFFAGNNGDYYWQFDINGQQVVHRPRNQDLSIDPGRNIDLDASKMINVGKGAVIRLSGWVMDRDGATNGADEWCGDFDIHINESSIPLDGSAYDTSKKFQGVKTSGQTIHISIKRL